MLRSVPMRFEEVELPVIDLEPYLKDPSSGATHAQAVKAWESMCQLGISVVRDPRADHNCRGPFLELEARLWHAEVSVREACLGTDKKGMAVGWWPPGSETARDWRLLAGLLPPEHQPHTVFMDTLRPDIKGRWHHRLWLQEWEDGLTPEHLAKLHSEQLVPPGDQFTGWIEAHDNWGRQLLRANITHAELVALGGGLEIDYFSAGMKKGTNLLAPTIIDLFDLQPWEVIAAWHYDLDRFAMHGAADYPGLIVWTRDWRPVQPRIPQGCFLCQSGAEAEHMTGGQIWRGMHEVVAFPNSVEFARGVAEHWRTTLRIGSHCFGQGGDDIIAPHPRWRTIDTMRRYPPMKASTHQAVEIALITGSTG